jgi:CRP/FNR family transcriptional regulator, cyclic AMP receptor protein
VTPASPHYAHCLAALQRQPFFARLSGDVQKDILGLFRYQTIYKRDTSIAKGETNELFYLVVNGRAKVSRLHPETGREHILYLLGSGDSFDIIHLLHGKPQDVVVTALDDLEILTTPLPNAREWLDAHPDFSPILLPYLGEQMQKLAEHIEDLALHDTEARLARLILRHAVSLSPTHGLNLIDDLSQETLASMIGTVRVVVTQHMQNWKRQGILSGGRGKWSITDLQALLEKAHGGAQDSRAFSHSGD